MYMPNFDYHTVQSVSEASVMLNSLGPEAKLLAGGTDILPLLKRGEINPKALISITGLQELKGIDVEPERGLVIGALNTHNEVMKSRTLQNRYLSICKAAHSIGNNQIRNIGTIGGNIANAVPSGDLLPILIALGAEVLLESSNKSRVLPLDELFLGVRKTVIKQNEILTKIIIPDQGFTGSTYLKFKQRRSGALAVVGVAVAVTMEDNICKDARIALGAAGPTPLRITEAEEIFKGKEITDNLLEEVGQFAAAQCNPRDSLRGSREYRKEMVKVFTKRSLRKAIDHGHC